MTPMLFGRKKSRDRTIALIVPADEPALFFNSIRDAEGYLEAIDVDNGVYGVAYGPQGQLYKVTSQNDQVVILSEPDRPDEPEALRAVLLCFLDAVGIKTDPAEDLASLLKRCEPYID